MILNWFYNLHRHHYTTFQKQNFGLGRLQQGLVQTRNTFPNGDASTIQNQGNTESPTVPPFWLDPAYLTTLLQLQAQKQQQPQLVVVNQAQPPAVSTSCGPRGCVAAAGTGSISTTSSLLGSSVSTSDNPGSSSSGRPSSNRPGSGNAGRPSFGNAGRPSSGNNAGRPTFGNNVGRPSSGNNALRPGSGNAGRPNPGSAGGRPNGNSGSSDTPSSSGDAAVFEFHWPPRSTTRAPSQISTSRTTQSSDTPSSSGDAAVFEFHWPPRSTTRAPSQISTSRTTQRPSQGRNSENNSNISNGRPISGWWIKDFQIFFYGGKHHQDKTNGVVDVYHKFSCSENRMILLVVYPNLAVREPIFYPKRETS